VFFRSDCDRSFADAPMKGAMRRTATVGFRAKTGRAIAVALTGTRDEPQLVWRGEISLVDPSVPETSQPYHAVMDLPWTRGSEAAKPFVRAIAAIAAQRIAGIRSDLESRGFALRRVVTVGSHDRILEKIGNPHMRAHAAEGMVFRRVLDEAAETAGLRVETISDRAIREAAVSRLHFANAKIQSTLKKLGAEAGPPWRADEKAAAMGAWIALGNH